VGVKSGATGLEPATSGVTGRRSSHTRIVLASRVAHGLISLLFLFCIAAIYLGAWRGKADAVTIAALAALCVEAALVLLSGGNCPLAPVLRKLGDETPFFELVLPPRAAKLAVPVLGAVSVLGAVLLAARAL
jgi:hypothetical protein